MRIGDSVRLIDGEGAEALAEVEAVEGDRVDTRVLDRRSHSRTDGVLLSVAQALLKGRSFDDVVRRCAELGVCEIVPVRTARAVGRLREEDEAGRLERWRAVALAAVKQSRGVFVPSIAAPVDLSEALGRGPDADLALLAWEEEDARSLRKALREAGSPRRLFLVVGPEGGLCAAEVEEARVAGIEPVGLGRRILRADWAAPAVAAMVAYELGGLLP